MKTLKKFYWNKLSKAKREAFIKRYNDEDCDVVVHSDDADIDQEIGNMVPFTLAVCEKTKRLKLVSEYSGPCPIGRKQIEKAVFFSMYERICPSDIFFQDFGAK